MFDSYKSEYDYKILVGVGEARKKRNEFQEFMNICWGLVPANYLAEWFVYTFSDNPTIIL